MKKTEKYQYIEAYTQGYQDATKELNDALDKIKAWTEAPEWDLVQAIRTYVEAK